MSARLLSRGPEGLYGPYIEVDLEPGDSLLVPVDRDPSCGTCRTGDPHLHEARS